jgi:hypothetical protein
LANDDNYHSVGGGCQEDDRSDEDLLIPTKLIPKMKTGMTQRIHKQKRKNEVRQRRHGLSFKVAVGYSKVRETIKCIQEMQISAGYHTTLSHHHIFALGTTLPTSLS